MALLGCKATPSCLEYGKRRRKDACWWSIWQNRDASSVVNWLSHKRSLPWPINPDSRFGMTVVPPTPWWFLEGVWLALWHSGIIFLHPTSSVPGCIEMSSNYLVKMSTCQALWHTLPTMQISPPLVRVGDSVWMLSVEHLWRSLVNSSVPNATDFYGFGV